MYLKFDIGYWWYLWESCLVLVLGIHGISIFHDCWYKFVLNLREFARYVDYKRPEI